jgi:hypothetical protein
MNRALWLLLAVTVVEGCSTYRQQLTHASDDQVCFWASQGPGLGWNANNQAAVTEAMSRGLSANDCDASNRQCLQPEPPRILPMRLSDAKGTARFEQCRLKVISDFLKTQQWMREIDAQQQQEQRDRDIQSQIDAANARARDADQRAWDAEQRARAAEIRRQESEQMLEEEGR